MVFYVILLGAVLVLSSIFLLRRRSSTSTPATTPSGLAEPPRVPAWLPFVGNALDFGRNSQGFLQQCQAAYGDAFRLKMMGQDYVFVLDPFSFPNVFREEKKNLSFIAIVREFACKCFGASEAEFEKQNHETVHKYVQRAPSSLSFFFAFVFYFYFVKLELKLTMTRTGNSSRTCRAWSCPP
jgi:hypothetical protein